jgi:hypothetical protein
VKLAAAIVILATAWPATAAADLCDKAIKVEAGAKAPCEGVLWPNAVTAKVLRCPGQLRTCQAQAKRDAAVAAADQAEAAARAKRDLDVAQAATQAAEALAGSPRGSTAQAACPRVARSPGGLVRRRDPDRRSPGGRCVVCEGSDQPLTLKKTKPDVGLPPRAALAAADSVA